MSRLSSTTHSAKAAPHSKRTQSKTRRCAKSRKRVQFAEQHNRIIGTVDGNCSSTNDASDVQTKWYRLDEYRNFQLEARRTLAALLERGNDPSALDPSEHCLRGLEKHQIPPKARAMYKEQNRQFIRLIICEHLRLRQQGVTDPECLKKLSSMYTVPARNYAMFLAQRSDE